MPVLSDCTPFAVSCVGYGLPGLTIAAFGLYCVVAGIGGGVLLNVLCCGAAGEGRGVVGVCIRYGRGYLRS